MKYLENLLKIFAICCQKEVKINFTNGRNYYIIEFTDCILQFFIMWEVAAR